MCAIFDYEVARDGGIPTHRRNGPDNRPRKSYQTGVTSAYTWCIMLARNEVVLQPRDKKTDEQLLQEMRTHVTPMPGHDLTLLDVAHYRRRYNLGILAQQQQDKPLLQSRQYIRLNDGRVFVAGKNGRVLGQYTYEMGLEEYRVRKANEAKLLARVNNAENR
jgi:hypothetical protein